MNFECFCRLSANHTYITCQNFLCQYSLMAETTVKQRAFAFIIDRLRVPTLGYPALFTRSGHTVINPRARDSARPWFAWRRSWHGTVYTVSPAPLWHANGMQQRRRRGKPAYLASLRMPTSGDFADQFAHAWYELPCALSPISSQSFRVVIDVCGTIYLRLKPHPVEISSDIVTEYSCQVCILSMMFCRSDRRLCWLG